MATKKAAAAKKTAAVLDPAGPMAVKVQCVNKKCAQHEQHITTAAGVQLAPGVLLTGTLSCQVCGLQLELVHDR